MNKSKFKQQLGTFSEFCKSKKRQSIKENSSVAIEVPFWDDAVLYALDNLRLLGGGGNSIDWNRMVDRIKMKFSLLNIFDKGIFTDDAFVIAHVKDIIYHNFCATGYLSDAAGDADNYDSQELGAKAFVLSKLADAVLAQVKEESGILIEPEPEEPTFRWKQDGEKRTIPLLSNAVSRDSMISPVGSKRMLIESEFKTRERDLIFA